MPSVRGRRDVARLPQGTERVYVGRSLMGQKRRIVNAEIAGSSPVGPPISIRIANCGFAIPVNPKSQIGDRPGIVAERRMHFPVEGDDDVRVRSVPPT